MVREEHRKSGESGVRQNKKQTLLESSRVVDCIGIIDNSTGSMVQELRGITSRRQFRGAHEAWIAGDWQENGRWVMERSSANLLKMGEILPC
jgi:hypothetical protein